MPHAGRPIGARHLVHLGAGGADAGEVRRRRQAGFLHDARHRRMGAGLGGAAGAIGDRDEARPQRLQSGRIQGPELGSSTSAPSSAGRIRSSPAMSPRASANSGCVGDRAREASGRSCRLPRRNAAGACAPRHRVTVSSPPSSRSISVDLQARRRRTTLRMAPNRRSPAADGRRRSRAVPRGRAAAKSTTSRPPARSRSTRAASAIAAAGMGIMKHLVDDHTIGALIGERQRIPQSRLSAAMRKAPAAPCRTRRR